MKKVIVLYQDWGNWLTKDYSRFEYWFKKMDGAYSKDNDYFVIALGNTNKEFYAEKNVKVKIIKSTPFRQIIDLFKIRKEINKNKDYDVIYSPFIYMLSIVPKGFKVIGFLRDKTPEMIKAKGGIKRMFSYMFYLLDYIAFKKINLLLYNGIFLKKYAKNLGFNSQSKLIKRPIVDKEYFKEASSKDIINKYNLKDKKIILTVSRLSKEKNIEMGIKAMNFLDNNYVYIIIGQGEEEGRLKNMSKGKNVLFLGHIEHKNIWKYYKIADVFWLLSTTEGNPNVLQEAQYAGLPCVVSKIPAMRNTIENGKNGIVLDTWESKKLAEKTKYVVENKNKMSINCKKIAEDIIKKNIPVGEFF